MIICDVESAKENLSKISILYTAFVELVAQFQANHFCQLWF